MKELAADYPEPSDVINLEPEELGARILFLGAEIWGDKNFSISSLSVEYRNIVDSMNRRKREIEIAFAEALSWLIAQGLIYPDPGQGGSFYLLSRRAHKFASSKDVIKFASARKLPREILHSSIAETVWAAFMRGEYDVAVFQAMKQVEISVRRTATMADSEVGVSLMRKAFHTTDGRLSDQVTLPAEREATMALFAGAIGLFKNPQSHREVSLQNPDEAIEVVLLANHLLRIVDTRAKSLSANG